MLEAIFWSGLATVTLFIGIFLAFRNLVNFRWTGLLLAFGAGAMICVASIQLILGSLLTDLGSPYAVALGVAAGALTFYFADKWVDRLGGADRMDLEGGQASGSGLGIFLGTLLDGIPESLVLGISLASNPQVSFAFIFAVAIGNIPQGLGAATGMLSSGWSKRKITDLHLAVCGLCILAAALGYGVATVSAKNISGSLADAFAGGALLVMLADSMIPEAFEHAGRETGLSLVLGFGASLGLAVAQAT